MAAICRHMPKKPFERESGPNGFCISTYVFT